MSDEKGVFGLKIKQFFAFFCVFCLALTLVSCSKKNKPDPGPSVPVVVLQESVIPFYKDYIGTTQSIASVAIKARVEGFLLEKHFTEGTLVKKNQLLYVIDKRPFEAAVALAKGTLARNRADEEYQRVQYVRMKELVRKGDVSQSQYDEVNAQYKAAVASVDVAQAQLEEAEINLSYCSMFSPIEGLIGRRYVDLGNLVGGGSETLLVNVLQLDPMYVQFSPSVEDFRVFLKYQGKHPFKVEAWLDDRKKILFKGTMDLINNEAEILSSTIYSRALIGNKKQLLRPGVYVNIRVHLSDQYKALLIPSRAVMEVQGQKTVFIVNDKNEIELRQLKAFGEYKQQIVIKSGLCQGDRVVTEGLQKLYEGERVSPQLTVAKVKHG
jgi:RND family efflux transporter MFP subunit